MNREPNRPRDELDAWLRGELDDDASARFLALAREDPELAREVGELAATIADVRDLRTELEPERDLWPGIAARLAPARPRRVNRWLLAGLAAALLVAAGVTLGRRSIEPRTVVARTAEAPSAPAGPALAAYAASDAALERVRVELRAEVERRSSELPDATRRVVDDNLATIDRAIAEIEQALAAHPDDPELARTYVQYRQREIDFLRRVNRSASRL